MEKSFETIQRLHAFSFTKYENRKGKPIMYNKKEFIIPSPYEILSDFCSEILNCGFSKVERVAPDEANCIIRVFEKRHLKGPANCFENRVYNLYGGNCFIKKDNDWIARSENDTEFKFNPEKCEQRLWLYQDDFLEFEADFVDFYVRIS